LSGKFSVHQRFSRQIRPSTSSISLTFHDFSPIEAACGYASNENEKDFGVSNSGSSLCGRSGICSQEGSTVPEDGYLDAFNEELW
jgi:hypothetical protein